MGLKLSEGALTNPLLDSIVVILRVNADDNVLAKKNGTNGRVWSYVLDEDASVPSFSVPTGFARLVVGSDIIHADVLEANRGGCNRSTNLAGGDHVVGLSARPAALILGLADTAVQGRLIDAEAGVVPDGGDACGERNLKCTRHGELLVLRREGFRRVV